MNLNAVLGTAIAKGACRATRKPIAGLRRDVAELKRQISELKRAVRSLQNEEAGVCAAAVSEGAAEAAAAQRPTSKMIRKLRATLGLTQAEFAKLTGVTSLTVSKWETAEGRITPRARALAGLAYVRTLSKRTARAALDQS